MGERFINHRKEAILSKITFLNFYCEYIPTLKEKGNGQAMGICPFHQDTNPSLSVNLEKGIFNCFACGIGGDVFDFYQKIRQVSFPTALKEIGRMVGLNGATVKPQVVGIFKYQNEVGQVVYSKERIEPGRDGRRKDFLIYHIKNEKRVKGRGGDSILYNLPGLAKNEGPLYFAEGEKKADQLVSWGLAGTCLDSGSNSRWRPDYLPHLQGKDVVILPDNDEPGRAYAKRIAGTLAGHVKSIKIIELPGLPEEGDVLDWIKDPGNDKEKFLSLVESAAIWESANKSGVTGLKAVTISELLKYQFKPRATLLHPWLFSQGLAMVHAPRGIGKTLFAIDLAIAGTSGGVCFQWSAPEPFGVLYIDGEMPGVALQERFARTIKSSEKEPEAPLRIITPDLQEDGMPDLATVEGQEKLEPHLEGISLVIVDNLSTLIRSGRENEGESWGPVQEWALRLRSRGFSILFIHHDNKAGGQRGHSKKEDVLDTVIHLKKPGDYRPEEGARFEVHFEKARMLFGDDVKPFEAKLTTKLEGTQAWIMKDLEQSQIERVADLLNDGVPQKEIAEMLGVVKGTVSKYKNKAHALGLLKK